MNIFTDVTNPAVARALRQGHIGVVPSDTLYGLMASTASPKAIERLYEVRQRDADKACVVLIAEASAITDTVLLQPAHREIMERWWPGPVSIILPVSDATPSYIPRFKGTVAYRVPADPKLRQLLYASGPLLAPSANPQGQQPASTVQQAIDYFGDAVDFYVDGGDLGANQPSTLVRIGTDGQVEVLRGQLPA